MTATPPPRPRSRRIRRFLAVGLVLGIAAIAAALGHRSWNAAPSSPEPLWSSSVASPLPSSPAPPSKPPPKRRGAVGEADGVVPYGVTVFDDGVPAVTNLDPDLLAALRRAAAEAAGDGVEFYVNSGWRSAEYQERLFRRAVSEYGSEAAAARWVATPATSLHVSGDAVDIGHSDATAWLSEHGARYGLCQIYRNEPWHYELRTDAVHRGCPRMFADPSQDPRMRR
ncbi:peptidase M15 [Actinomadura sp. 6K520]|nr:peptidase M15 [Actinomadura sp. 6K520]